MTHLDRLDVEYQSGGDKIRGWLHLPADTSGPVPAVVFCPGYTGTRYAAFYEPYVARMTDAGYAVLLSDYRGWGDSEGHRGVIDPLAQVEDLRRGLTFLETRPEVDPLRLALFGVSFGGGHATYVAGMDDRVRAAVSVSGVADGREWLRRMRPEHEWQDYLDRLAEERLRTVLGEPATLVHPNEEIQVSTPERRATTVKGRVDPAKVPQATPLECAQAIIDYRPLLLAPLARAMLWLYVERDSIVPAEHSRSMYEAAREPRRLVALPGRGHYSAYVEHFDRIWEETSAWLSIHL